MNFKNSQHKDPFCSQEAEEMRSFPPVRGALSTVRLFPLPAGTGMLPSRDPGTLSPSCYSRGHWRKEWNKTRLCRARMTYFKHESDRIPLGLMTDYWWPAGRQRYTFQFVGHAVVRNPNMIGLLHRDAAAGGQLPLQRKASALPRVFQLLSQFNYCWPKSRNHQIRASVSISND